MLEPAWGGVGQALRVSIVGPSVGCRRMTVLSASRLVQVGSGTLERQCGCDWSKRHGMGFRAGL